MPLYESVFLACDCSTEQIVYQNVTQTGVELLFWAAQMVLIFYFI